MRSAGLLNSLPLSVLCRIRDNTDRGVQYTSSEYRAAIKLYGINQSMNSDGGRCHDNARCESMWARLKEELFYEGLPPLIKRRMYYESEMGMVA